MHILQVRIHLEIILHFTIYNSKLDCNVSMLNSGLNIVSLKLITRITNLKYNQLWL